HWVRIVWISEQCTTRRIYHRNRYGNCLNVCESNSGGSVNCSLRRPRICIPRHIDESAILEQIPVLKAENLWTYYLVSDVLTFGSSVVVHGRVPGTVHPRYRLR